MDRETFMADYKIKHEVCPNCGSNVYMTNLLGMMYNSEKPEEYKNTNHCTCMACEHGHIAHDRVSREEFYLRKTLVACNVPEAVPCTEKEDDKCNWDKHCKFKGE